LNEQKQLIIVPITFKVFLALLSLFGFLIIFISTSKFGVGLSPDSIGYISTARNIADGTGVLSYDGNPLVVQPPLYPAILGFIDYLIGIDPVTSTKVVNSIIFCLIIYFGGMLTFKFFSFWPTIAFLGTFIFVFSSALISISTMAWSEPLFILFTLLSFCYFYKYEDQNNKVTLIIFSIIVALSTLTRYIGVTLIIWGIIVIVINSKANIKIRFMHMFLFSVISSTPLFLWMIRNYSISGTFFGPRASSIYSLYQNLYFSKNNILLWFLPQRISSNNTMQLLLLLFFVLFILYEIKNKWQTIKNLLKKTNSLLLFSFIYSSFLIISSTTTAYDKINNRLLSPVYIPITLLLLIFFVTIFFSFEKYFPRKYIKMGLILCIVVWLFYPVRNSILLTSNIFYYGQGYSSNTWQESETIDYVMNNRGLVSEHIVYTNGPDVFYYYFGDVAKMTPQHSKYNSLETLDQISDLVGYWPQETEAYIIWFDNIKRNYLFSIDEIKGFTNLNLIKQFEDGEIYFVSRR